MKFNKFDVKKYQFVYQIMYVFSNKMWNFFVWYVLRLRVGKLKLVDYTWYINIIKQLADTRHFQI